MPEHTAAPRTRPSWLLPTEVAEALSTAADHIHHGSGGQISKSAAQAALIRAGLQHEDEALSGKRTRPEPPGMRRVSLYVTQESAAALDAAADQVLTVLGDDTPRHVALSALLLAGVEHTEAVAQQRASELAARLATSQSPPAAATENEIAHDREVALAMREKDHSMSTTIEIKIRREISGTVEEHSRVVTTVSEGNPRFVAYDLQPKAQKLLDQVIRCFGDPDDKPGRAGRTVMPPGITDARTS